MRTSLISSALEQAEEALWYMPAEVVRYMMAHPQVVVSIEFDITASDAMRAVWGKNESKLPIYRRN